MEVFIDGVIYQRQERGGISRIFNEILPRMCDLDASLSVDVLIEGKPRQKLPTHTHIRQLNALPLDPFLPVRPVRFWQRVLPPLRQQGRQRQIERHRDYLWHSTYYTLPDKEWRGPTVLTVPDMIHERYPNYFSRPEDDAFRQQKRQCIQSADAIICISETTRTDLQAYYAVDSSKLHVIPLAHSSVFQQRQITSSEILPTGEPFFLYVGKRDLYKNFGSLLEAYRRWPGQREVKLVVVGRSWTAQESQQLADSGIQERVRLLGKVSDTELCDLYNRAAAFVYPSLYEGFGIPLLEAMACGCPIVASRIPATVEVAAECPIYFDPEHLDSFVAALQQAIMEGLESPRCAAGLSKAATYSWDKNAAQTLQCYRALAAVP
ncbi:MAG: glycosyltransferase family 1 protein [Chloroflexota bacterium]